MIQKSLIPPSIIEAKEKEPLDDDLIRIKELEDTLNEAKKTVRYTESDIAALKEKRRKDIKIPWKDSSYWCLEIDSDGQYYFLKSSMGVANCVAYKNSVDLDANIKSKVATALSWLYLHNKIGRTTHNGTVFYGIPDLFKKDEDGRYSILKEKHVKNLDKLREVNRAKIAME